MLGTPGAGMASVVLAMLLGYQHPDGMDQGAGDRQPGLCLALLGQLLPMGGTASALPMSPAPSGLCVRMPGLLGSASGCARGSGAGTCREQSLLPTT